MYLELILGLFGVLVLWDYLYKRRRNQLLDAAGIPGPKTLPILGNILLLKGNDTLNIFGLLQRLRDQHGKFYRLWFVNNCIFFIQDAKYFESVLGSQQVIAKNDLYNLLSAWLGQGLLLSTGPKWFSRRKIITPTFHFKILEHFSEIFDQQSRVMAKRLYAKADGKTALNIFPEICLTALDIIAETAMGVKIHAQEHPEFAYAKAVTE